MKTSFIDAAVFIDKPELLEPLKEIGQVEVFEGIPASVDEVVQRAGDAEIIAFGLMQFTNEMLDRLPALKVLQFIGTGVSNFVDMDYAKSKGIEVLNIEGYGSNAVAEFAVAMGMTLAKKIPMANGIVKRTGWTTEGLVGKEIKGSTVGVIGTGSIGAMVAEKYVQLGAKVIGCDIFENPHLKEKYAIPYKKMDEVFKEADILTLHMKVTKENERSIGEQLLSLMKEDALFINVARAELVDTDALYDALVSGKLGGAAIDVYDSEPPSEKDYKLAQLDNVVATPHIAYYTQEASDNSIKMSVSSILASVKA